MQQVIEDKFVNHQSLSWQEYLSLMLTLPEGSLLPARATQQRKGHFDLQLGKGENFHLQWQMRIFMHGSNMGKCKHQYNLYIMLTK